MKSEVSFPPYSYPDPSFRPLASQESIEGIFREPNFKSAVLPIAAPQEAYARDRIGKNPSQVEAGMIRIKKKGQVHPANPIVHWANLARSESVPIEYVMTKAIELSFARFDKEVQRRARFLLP